MLELLDATMPKFLSDQRTVVPSTGPLVRVEDVDEQLIECEKRCSANS